MPDKIRMLSQDEGLFDHEIADLLSCHRTTITRYRKANDIPPPNLQNRRDKQQECKRCGETSLIRRHERRRKHCPSCRRILWEARLEKKRIRWRENGKKHSAGMLLNNGITLQ